MIDTSPTLAGSESVVRYVRDLPTSSFSDRLIVLLVDSELRLRRVLVNRFVESQTEVARKIRTAALIDGASGIIVVENRTAEGVWPSVPPSSYRPIIEQLTHTGVSLVDVIQIRGSEVRTLSGLRHTDSE